MPMFHYKPEPEPEEEAPPRVEGFRPMTFVHVNGEHEYICSLGGSVTKEAWMMVYNDSLPAVHFTGLNDWHFDPQDILVCFCSGCLITLGHTVDEFVAKLLSDIASARAKAIKDDGGQILDNNVQLVAQAPGTDATYFPIPVANINMDPQKN